VESADCFFECVQCHFTTPNIGCHLALLLHQLLDISNITLCPLRCQVPQEPIVVCVDQPSINRLPLAIGWRTIIIRWANPEQAILRKVWEHILDPIRSRLILALVLYRTVMLSINLTHPYRTRPEGTELHVVLRPSSATRLDVPERCNAVDFPQQVKRPRVANRIVDGLLGCDQLDIVLELERFPSVRHLFLPEFCDLRHEVSRQVRLGVLVEPRTQISSIIQNLTMPVSQI